MNIYDALDFVSGVTSDNPTEPPNFLNIQQNIQQNTQVSFLVFEIA